MAIDQSPLTIVLYFLFIGCVVFVNYKKKHSFIQLFLKVLWALSICCIFSCCILPIQFTNTGLHMTSFTEQFSIMSFEQFKQYFLQYAHYNKSYIISFFLFAFSTTLMTEKMRKPIRAVLMLNILLCIHLLYNICLNLLIDEIVKYINFEDFILMIIGYLIGWINAYALIKVFPRLNEYIENIK